MDCSPVPVIELAGGRPGQVGIVVESLELAMAGYGVPAHMKPAWRIWTYDGAVLSERIFRGTPGHFVMRLALGGGEPQIELIEPIAGPSIYHEWIAERGYGLHHLGFYVPDTRAAITEMEDAGYPLLQAGFGFGADGSGGFAYFDTQDAVGYIVEAIEVPRERRSPESLWHNNR